ncbi:MAG: pilus assembly FimT family protein [Fluviibacter phosphoraccumulans]
MRNKNSGFTLIELLVVIVIVAMLAGLASLALPNREGQQWKSRLEQLTATLNFAQDEALSRATPLWVMVDQNGWRFFRMDRFENPQPLNQPQSFAPTAWDVPLKTSPVSLKLGDDAYPETKSLNFVYENSAAQILRDRFGRFRLELR